MTIQRRDILRGVAIAACWGGGNLKTARADEDSEDDSRGYWGLGTLIDFSACVPDPAAIKEAGHLGAVRYVCDRRPSESWMLAKPVTADEVEGMKEYGLSVTSVYQWGRGQSADWRSGYDGGVGSAEAGVALHLAAGGPVDGVIYAAIDDNPSQELFDTLITPYLTGWSDAIGNEHLGVYGNPQTISWCLEAGLGSYFWQHDWGNPSGKEHEEAHLHQLPPSRGNVRVIDNVQCDVSIVLQEDYGQWSTTLA